MRIINPGVTLADEARSGVREEVRSGFLDWLFQFSAEGDDGELYSIGGSILSMELEKMDLATFSLAKGTGSARQLPGSIYSVTDFPGGILNKFYRNPKGTLKIEKSEKSVKVSCGNEYKAECLGNGLWHIMIDTCDGEYSGDFYHQGHGFPLWYGRETPSYLTQHSITYGYNWAGDVYGSFCYKGKTVSIKGTGIRERYVAVDSSAAELGGWEDWGFFTFNEFHSSMYDMRLGKKDFSLYDLRNDKHYPEGKMEIIHSNWAFMRELDGFIPMNYRIKIEVEDGIYEIDADVVNATTWGVTYKVPDNPVATLTFGRVDGSFTLHDGARTPLSGGRGSLSIRQWHAYPSILPRELYSDAVLTGEKFETL